MGVLGARAITQDLMSAEGRGKKRGLCPVRRELVGGRRDRRGQRGARCRREGGRGCGDGGGGSGGGVTGREGGSGAAGGAAACAAGAVMCEGRERAGVDRRGLRAVLDRVHMDGRRIDVHVHVHVHWEALFVTCGVRHIEVRRAKVLIKVLIVVVVVVVVLGRKLVIFVVQPSAGSSDRGSDARGSRICVIVIVVVSGDPNETTECGNGNGARGMAGRGEEEVLGLVVALEAVEEGEESSVGGMRKEGAEVEIGELGCGEGADGSVGRGAREEDGERGQECGGVGETVNGDGGRVVGWDRGHGEEDGGEGRGGGAGRGAGI